MHKSGERYLDKPPLAASATDWKRSSGSSLSSTDTLPSAHAMAKHAELAPAEGAREDEAQPGFPSGLIQAFSPSFFASTMGTGIVSILLYNLPYQFPALEYIALSIFVLNIAMFSSGLLVGILHYATDTTRWSRMLDHPVESLYTGTFPMGLSTIVTMLAAACVEYWGRWVANLAFALWVIDAVLSVLICCWVPFMISSRHKRTGDLTKMTAAWLLPVVSTIVCSATGASVAESTMEMFPQRAAGIMVASFAMLGMGLPTACIVLTVYFHRLTTHGLVARELAVSVCLPLGPLGQGAFCFMQLGKVARYVVPLTLPNFPKGAGDTLYAAGWAAAMLLWGFGMFWVFFAVASLIKFKRFPVNKTWWAFTFPVGVIGTATTSFGKELSSGFFNVLGTFISILVLVLWLVVLILTTKKLYKRGLLPGSGESESTSSRRPSMALEKKKMGNGAAREAEGDGSPETTTEELKKGEV